MTDKVELMVDEYVVHKRKGGNINVTLCQQSGFRIFLSHRVTCLDCISIMKENKHE